MPSNPELDAKFQARRLINETLADTQEARLVDLEFAVLAKLKVGDEYPSRYIKKFFVETGRFKLDQGVLIRAS